jgi:DNA-binding LacI/PurR family transcriptional regulator
MLDLGLITNDQSGPFQSGIISGVQANLQRAEALHIFSLKHQALPADLKGFDGLIVLANALPDEQLRELWRGGVALSLISHHLPASNIPTLMFNHSQGIAILVRHLVVNCGRRRLAFVRGIPEQLDARQREAAFRREMMRHELPLDEAYFLRGDFDPTTASDSMAAFVESGQPLDGVLAADFAMAGAIKATLQAQGMAVPEAVSVVGFGDDASAEAAGISTVAANLQELGRRALRQLRSQIEGLPIRGVTTLNVQLIVRGSCGYQAP